MEWKRSKLKASPGSPVSDNRSTVPVGKSHDPDRNQAFEQDFELDSGRSFMGADLVVHGRLRDRRGIVGVVREYGVDRVDGEKCDDETLVIHRSSDGASNPLRMVRGAGWQVTDRPARPVMCLAGETPLMVGPHPSKVELEGAIVYVHVKDEASGANVTHIDVEHPALNDIIEPGENSFVGGKDGGVFIGLKGDMIERAEAFVGANE